MAGVSHDGSSAATLGGSPSAPRGSLVAKRSWDDYSIGRGDAIEHPAALDLVYSGVGEDLLTGQTCHWGLLRLRLTPDL